MKNTHKHHLVAVLALTLFSASANAQTTTQSAAQAPKPAPSATTAATPDDDWHFILTPYIWFAGMHGDVGARGFDASVHASFGEIFSYLNFGLMGEMEARKRKWMLSTDFMWIRIKDEKALPVKDFAVTSVDARVKEFFITPKVGYRVLDKKAFKLDAQVGVRYWHLGQGLEFSPAIRSGVSASQNWADVVAGARLVFPLTTKLEIGVIGDAGGGGANSDYQVGGIVSYKVGKATSLLVGYRYMGVNYRNKNGNIFDTNISGLLFGAAIHLK